MLSITSTPGRIGMQTTHARLDTSTYGGELNISTRKPKVEINGSFPTIEIDNAATKREFGYRSIGDIISEGADYGKQQARAALIRIVEDGNRMMNIKRGVPDAIPELAIKNSQAPPVSVEVELAGKSRPKTTVVGGYKIDFQPGVVSIDYNPRKIEAQYTPGKVEVYMQQYPDINYEYTIDKKI